jgi:hypothetical protein
MGRESHDKRERERKRQERSANKRARRDSKPDPASTAESVDSDALMERFRVLSEQRAAGVVTGDEYETQRLAIFHQLGLDASAALH